MISLRPYQSNDADRIRVAFRTHRAVLYQLPTGGGKTYTFSYVSHGASQKGRRVMILVHRQELLLQASQSLARIGLPHTLIAQDKQIRNAIANHVEELHHPFIDLNSRVAVASVDTLIRRLSMVTAPDLLIPDEAHHVIPGNKWGRVISTYDQALMLGVTATPVRTDGKGLGKSSGGMFDTLICGPSMRELIDQGYLLPPTVYAPPSVLDLTGVRTSGGDYATADLAARVDKPTITGDAVEHYARICPKVPAIAFCVSIAHAQHVAAQFRASGFDFRPIDGTMHDAERRNLIRALSRGQIHGLTSCDLISEGTDIPVVGCGILLRPTKSEGLNLQQVGRVLRPSPGQTKAFILDHVGNVLVHGMPDADREWTLDGRQKRAKGASKDEPRIAVAQCPKCYAAHAPAPACPQCGYVYDPSGRQVEQKDGELMEVTGEIATALRQRRNMENSRAKTYDDFVALAVQRGYSNTHGWARIQVRMRKNRAALVAPTTNA